MKQFTEQELLALKHNEFDAGFDDGFIFGCNVTQTKYRARLANQRRELRRLNRKLASLTRAVKAGAAIFDDQLRVEQEMMKLKQEGK